LLIGHRIAGLRLEAVPDSRNKKRSLVYPACQENASRVRYQNAGFRHLIFNMRDGCIP
jgi:hypothetical protein